MANILRVKINWTAFVGGPGYTNLYFRNDGSFPMVQTNANDAMEQTKPLLLAIQQQLPNSVWSGIDTTVDEIDETNGNLQGFWTIAPPIPANGGVAGAYSAASGACVSWYTNGIRNSRRVRGRTFVVPLGNTSFATDGTLDATKQASLQTAANNIIGGARTVTLGVWARPTGPNATDGIWYQANAAKIKDKAAVLTSRRD